MRRTLYLSIFLSLSLVLLSRVSAQELTVEGNGAGSSNSIVINSGTSVNNPQTNNFEAITNINATAETGNNSASQNNGNVTITTGDATVKVKVVNSANTNVSDPKASSTPIPSPTTQPHSSAPTPTSTPTSTSSSSSNSSSGGTGSAIGGAPVLGLSATSSTSSPINSLVTTIGLICLATAITTIKSSYHA